MFRATILLLGASLAWMQETDEAKRAIAIVKQVNGKLDFDPKAPGKRVVTLNLWNCGYPDAGLAFLPAFPHLRDLNLDTVAITDRDMSYMKNLRELEELRLGVCPISDAGVAHLADLPRLKYLDLWETKITDKGVALLKKLKSLEHLDVTNTAVTDASVDVLVGLPNLRVVYIGGTKISDAGTMRLQKARPKLEIHR